MNNSTIFYLLITGIVLATGTTVFFLSGTTPQTMTSDVVLYLPMMSDSSNSTFTKDWSRYGNNGTSTNTQYIPITTKNNNASYGYYNFNGYAQINTPLNLTNRNISLCLWNKNSTVVKGGVFGKATGVPYTVFSLHTSESGTGIQLYLGDGVSYDLNLWVSNANVLTDWNQYCVVINGTGTVFFYSNGVYLGNKTTALNSSTFIAAIAPTGYKQTSGYVSQIIVFNRTISASEVSTLYNSTKTIFQSDNMSVYKKFDNFFSYDTLLNFPFRNDTSNSTYTKNYGTQTNLSIINNGTVFNITDESYMFNGTNLSFMDFNQSISFSNTTSFGVSVWVYPKSYIIESFITDRTSNTNQLINLYAPSGLAGCRLRDDTGAGFTSANSPTLNVPLNNWTNIVCLRDVATDKVYVYVNGVLKINVTDLTVSSISPKIRIGATSSLSSNWNGSIDEIKIFSYTTLTSEQIMNNYLLGRNPDYLTDSKPNLSSSNVKRFDNVVAKSSSYSLNLPMRNDTSNNTYTKDYSPNNRVMTIFNSSYDTTTTSYIFNGVNSYINSSYPVLTSQQTVSLWIKPNVTLTSSSGAKYFVSKQNEFHIAYDYINGELTYLVYNSSSYEGNPGITTTLTPGTWYHIVGVHNSTNAMFYVNGTLVDTINISMTSPRNLAGPLYIGIDYALTASKSFNGSIDNVQILPIALTSTQIKTLYDYGRNPDYLTDTKRYP